MIFDVDLAKMHHASKIIEMDGFQGYYTCVERYGRVVANAVLMTWLRQQHNPKGQYPPPADMEGKIKKAIADNNLLYRAVRMKESEL